LVREEPKAAEFASPENYLLPDIRLYLTDLACRAWFISSRLVELRIRDRAQRTRIHSYARRLADHSSLFLSFEKSTRVKPLHWKPGISVDSPHLYPFDCDQVSFGLVCYFLNLGLFNSIFQAIQIHNEVPSRLKAVVYHYGPSDKMPPINMEEFYRRNEVTEPFSEAGHVAFEDNLMQMETSTWRGLSHLMDSLVWPRSVELDLRSKL
jgi:hypothetical protein